MRHRVRGKHLNRTSSHRAATRRNLACNLFLHGRVRMTPEKAKDVRSFVEKLITLARTDSVANFRRALSLLDDRFVVQKLFREIAPLYRERPGGYTRILKLDASKNRVGDNAQQVIFELVTETEADKEAREEQTKRSAVRDRLKRFGRRKGRSEQAAEEQVSEAKAEAGEPEERTGDAEDEEDASAESPDRGEESSKEPEKQE